MPGLSATKVSRAWPGARVGSRRVDVVAQGRGDHAYARKPTEDVPCTLFKAPKTTNQLAKHLNYLHHTLEGTLGN